MSSLFSKPKVAEPPPPPDLEEIERKRRKRQSELDIGRRTRGGRGSGGTILGGTSPSNKTLLGE